MSLLFEKPDHRALDGGGRAFGILLLLALLGRLIGHIAAPVVLNICCLTRALRVGIAGLAARGACHAGASAPLAGRPAPEPQVELLARLPNA